MLTRPAWRSLGAKHLLIACIALAAASAYPIATQAGLVRTSGPLKDDLDYGSTLTMYDTVDNPVSYAGNPPDIGDLGPARPIVAGDKLTFGCTVITNDSGAELNIDGAQLIGNEIGYEVAGGPLIGDPMGHLVCSASGPLELHHPNAQEFGPDGYNIPPGESAYIAFTLRYTGPNDATTEGVQVDYTIDGRKHSDFATMAIQLCQSPECEGLEQQEPG